MGNTIINISLPYLKFPSANSLYLWWQVASPTAILRLLGTFPLPPLRDNLLPLTHFWHSKTKQSVNCANLLLGPLSRPRYSVVQATCVPNWGLQRMYGSWHCRLRISRHFHFSDHFDAPCTLSTRATASFARANFQRGRAILLWAGRVPTCAFTSSD
jgi:hypothetical protein